MNRWIIILTFFLTGSGSIFCQPGILDKKVKLETTEGTIGSILDELGKKGSFVFSYGQTIPHNKHIQLKYSRQTVRQFLDEIFQGDIYCVEFGNKLLIRQKTKIPEVYLVRGKVMNALTKEPIPGVTV